MATFTKHQVNLINGVDKYHSTCRGVFYTLPTNRWFVEFATKEKIKIHLGFFDTEEEAIEAYSKYHEKYYQELVTKIEKDLEKAYRSSDTSKF